MQQQQRWASTWPKGLSWHLARTLLSAVPDALASHENLKRQDAKDSEEDMYLISKGILAVWSSQIYRGYALLTEKRVKRWIIDPYRIIHRPRIVTATKRDLLSFLWTSYPEFFFSSFSTSLSGSSPDASCQSIPSHCLVRWWRACEWSQWFVLWKC